MVAFAAGFLAPWLRKGWRERCGFPVFIASNDIERRGRAAFTHECQRAASHFPHCCGSTALRAGCAPSGHSASSPCVPVAIRSDAASRIAVASISVASTTGVFIVTRSRCPAPRVVAQNCEWPGKIFDYAGSGRAIETLIESTVRVTIRHSDNAPIASEAATASVSRDDATGAERPLKPAAPGDRFMAGDP